MVTGLTRGAAGSVVDGELAAIGQAPAVEVAGVANFVISGAFVGTFRLAASFDDGANWVPVTTTDGAIREFTKPERVVLEEPEEGVLYRVECTARTSGRASWRFSK